MNRRICQTLLSLKRRYAREDPMEAFSTFDLADRLVGHKSWTSRIERFREPHPNAGHINTELLPKAANPGNQKRLDSLMNELRRRNQTEVLPE